MKETRYDRDLKKIQNIVSKKNALTKNDIVPLITKSADYLKKIIETVRLDHGHRDLDRLD